MSLPLIHVLDVRADGSYAELFTRTGPPDQPIDIGREGNDLGIGIDPFDTAVSRHAVVVTASDRPGMMSAVTKVLADHQANIRYVDLHSAGLLPELLTKGLEVAQVLLAQLLRIHEQRTVEVQQNSVHYAAFPNRPPCAAR